ncbi:MAG: glycoside hydrolase family protein [Pseudomonadota bacterium]
MPLDKQDPGSTSPMKMSLAGRSNLRARERAEARYYDDMGPGRGNCTWGAGILAHKGPCTAEELKRPVSDAAVAAEFSSRVADAERTVRIRVKHQVLDQDQFDALVSYTFNLGPHGAGKVLELVDKGKLREAATKMSSMTRVRVKTKHGSKLVIARGLISRRAEESAPFRK